MSKAFTAVTLAVAFLVACGTAEQKAPELSGKGDVEDTDFCIDVAGDQVSLPWQGPDTCGVGGATCGACAGGELCVLGRCQAGPKVELVSATRAHYGFTDLWPAAFAYSDRDYVFSELPRCLRGERLLVTAAVDKRIEAPSLLQLRSDVPVNVYVGYDRRYEKRPSWLVGDYERTTLAASVVDPRDRDQPIHRFDYRRSKSPLTEISLGGNAPDDDTAYGMYTVVFVPADRDRCSVPPRVEQVSQAPTLGHSYGMGVLEPFAFAYSDKNYMFREVPTCLQGKRYLVTASLDKYVFGEDLLRLRSEVAVNVYVGYDKRYETRPDWLARYSATDLTATTTDPVSDMTMGELRFFRSASATTDISLGGNSSSAEFTSEFQMYTVVFVPADEDQCPR